MLKYIQILVLLVIFPILAMFMTELFNPLLGEFGSFGQTVIKLMVIVAGIFLLVKILNIISFGRDESYYG